MVFKKKPAKNIYTVKGEKVQGKVRDQRTKNILESETFQFSYFENSSEAFLVTSHLTDQVQDVQHTSSEI